MNHSSKPTSKLSPERLALLELLLEEEGTDSSPTPKIPRRKEANSCPLSFAQERIWFFEQLEPGTAVYNIANAVRIEGPLDLDALCEALNQILRRHESLRTRFVTRQGQPRQLIIDDVGFALSFTDLSAWPDPLSQAQRLAKAPAGDPVFGVHHFANAGEVSWKAFAEGVFDLALGSAAPEVTAIATADRPSPARRPMRGTLATGKLERVFGVTPRPWRAALGDIVAELKSEQRSAA